MAGNVTNKVNSMFSSLGAVQTLVETFPMSFTSLGNGKFSTSFDVISMLLLILGVSREEVIEVVTTALCGDKQSDGEGSGFIASVEEIVKMALEANIMNILNCTTNPIISNNLLDTYEDIGTNTEMSGSGITLSLAEIDLTGVLNRNPFYDKQFYFDTDERNMTDIHESKDFNAFLWYIINKSDKSQVSASTWDNRYRAAIYGKGNDDRKEIIKCTYIDDKYPHIDSIQVQLCSSNYYKRRKLLKVSINNENGGVDEEVLALNKTIFEFNHEFLSSIKLYDSKVIVAEIVEYLLGNGNLSVNLGFSLNEQIIQGKIQQIIKNVIEADDLEVNDCFYSFSNDEYNEMLEKAEQNRFNVINSGDGFYETNSSDILNNLTGITSNSEPINDKGVVKKTLTDITLTNSNNLKRNPLLNVEYDWEFEIIRALVYPFVRPLFTPKVLFLLMVNRKIMGSLDEATNLNTDDVVNKLMDSLFVIIKDIIKRIKDLIIDMLLSFVLKKIKPLVALLASRLLLEALQMYKNLLMEIIECFKLFGANIKFIANNVNGAIDDVNYADIIVTEQTEPEQTIC